MKIQKRKIKIRNDVCHKNRITLPHILPDIIRYLNKRYKPKKRTKKAKRAPPIIAEKEYQEEPIVNIVIKTKSEEAKRGAPMRPSKMTRKNLI